MANVFVKLGWRSTLLADRHHVSDPTEPVSDAARLRIFVSDKALAVGPSVELFPTKPTASALPLSPCFLNLAAFDAGSVEISEKCLTINVF
jgi:hypothetical protein